MPPIDYDEHPHAAEQDQVERRAQAHDLRQGRQGVGDPADGRGWVELAREIQHRLGRLDGHHIQTPRGQPRRIAPCPGAHVHHQGARRRGQEVGEPAMHVGRRQRLEPGGDLFYVGAVPIGRVGHGWGG
jgi:hypothetical protein